MNLLKNMALLLAAVVIAAVAAEGAMRAAGFQPRAIRVNPFMVSGKDTTWADPDAELGWVNKPGVSRSIEEGNALMTFWDFSRRASRADSAPPVEGLPVMVIGGSNAQSYGVRDDETFVTLLGERFPQLWFENFGTGGYSTVQAMMLGARAYDHFYGDAKPKLILLAFDEAHMMRNVADQSWIYSISDAQGRYVAPPHYRIENGKMVFHPFATIGFWPLETHSAAMTVLHNVWLQSFAYNTARQAVPVTREVIDRLATYAKDHQALFAVAVLEDQSGTSADLLRDTAFPHVDCSAPARADPKAYLLGGNSHPNPQLHAFFASCIGGWLETDILPKLEALR